MVLDSAQVSFDELRDLIRGRMAAYQIPGAAVGALWQGRDFVASFGETSVDHRLPVDPDTIFQIGSITKTFTATAAMRLVEMGALDLDAPIRAYVPSLRLADEDTTTKVTLRHLFTHTAGWLGGDFLETGAGDDALARYVENMRDIPQVTSLGEVWSYSNSSFCLAGRVIEVAAGKTYEAAVREFVLEPLGLTQSFFFPADVMLHRFAVGHSMQDGKLIVARPWLLPRSNNPAGGLASTVRDQLRYARFHMGADLGAGGTPAVRRESVALMQNPVCKGALDDQRGIAWTLRDVGGVRLVMHGGLTNGQQSNLMMVPKRGLAIIVLTNLAPAGGLLIQEIRKWVLKRYLDIEEPEPQRIDATVEQLRSCEGYYAGPLTDVDLHVQEGHLLMTVGPTKSTTLSETPTSRFTLPIALCVGDRFCLDGPYPSFQGEFIRNERGQIVWMRFTDTLLRRKEKDAAGSQPRRVLRPSGGGTPR